MVKTVSRELDQAPMLSVRYAGSGVVLYDGPSLIDGQRIVMVAIGFDGARNAKTGAGLIQTYILRPDLSPIDAVRSGADRSICGTCPHMLQGDGRRSCYVNLGHGPRVVWDAYRRGVYQPVDLETGAELFRSRRVRLGTYGDPAALPIWVWDSLLAYSGFITGYTHRWRESPEFAKYCMASADSSADRAAARLLGFRTFRVRRGDEALETGEVQCPAAAEAGKKTTCDACVACGGNSAKARADISIVAHGAGAGHYARRSITL